MGLLSKLGLFGKRTKELGTVAREVERDMELAHQLVEQETASGMVDMNLARELQSAAAADPGAVQAMQAYATRIARLFSLGVEQPATLRSIEVVQNALAPGGVTIRFQVTVGPPGGTPYEVSTEQVVPPAMAQDLAAGQRVTVKVDPNDPQSLMIWAAAGTSALAPAATEDPTERLSKLQDLRTSGVLTEEEFQGQKAKLLGGAAPGPPPVE